MRLLLGLPGTAPEVSVDTEWRAIVAGPAGDLALNDMAAGVRLSPMAGKGEKALLAAVASNDPAAIEACTQSGTDLDHVARLLLGLRLGSIDPVAAGGALHAVLESGASPWDHKTLRRYLPGLSVCVLLAPGVPAVLPANREAVALLLAEMTTLQGRHLDAVTLLTQQELTPVTALALCATYLVIGQNESVVKLTEGLGNFDDLTALCLVARGVALRASGRMDEALTALDMAVASPGRRPGMVAAALEERANLLRMSGEDLAAQADLERIAALDGTLPTEAVPPGATLSSNDPEPVPDVKPTTADDAEAMSHARSRLRRRIAGTGAPGTFGGRHHSTYFAEVEGMLSAGQLDAAETLLLGLVDAVEDEAEEAGIPIDPTFYLTLADVFGHRDQRAEETAVRERLERAGDRFGLAGEASELAQFQPEAAADVVYLDQPVA